MTGRIEFYDEPTAWGVILGEDGRVYVVRGSRAPGAAPTAAGGGTPVLPAPPVIT